MIVRFTVSHQAAAAVNLSQAPSAVAKQDVIEAGSPSPTSPSLAPSGCCEASDWLSAESEPVPGSTARKSVSKPADAVRSRPNAGLQVWD